MAHIDHIDPTWKEGRDYQLVCGLDVVYNMEERDPTLNRQKSNRFIPWRWSRDEIGGVPVNPGDFCLFLDFNTNEWVLEEFMGTWWFEQSRLWGFCGTNISEEAKRKMSEERTGVKRSAKTCQKISEKRRGRVYPTLYTEARNQKIREALIGQKHSAERRRNQSVAAAKREARKRCRRMAVSDPQMPDFED